MRNTLGDRDNNPFPLDAKENSTKTAYQLLGKQNPFGDISFEIMYSGVLPETNERCYILSPDESFPHDTLRDTTSRLPYPACYNPDCDDRCQTGTPIGIVSTIVKTDIGPDSVANVIACRGCNKITIIYKDPNISLIVRPEGEHTPVETPDVLPYKDPTKV
jgi:hypothetical protein